MNLPLIPTEVAPAATAAKAYSIWTSFPEGLKKINLTSHEKKDEVMFIQFKQIEQIANNLMFNGNWTHLKVVNEKL